MSPGVCLEDSGRPLPVRYSGRFDSRAALVQTQKMSSAPLSKHYLSVKGKQMAYHDVGEGDPVVFLHGNPTSSYLWRDIVPHVSSQARCIVPDLIGQGDSDKLDSPGADSYRFVEHREYLDGLLEQLDLGDKVTLVIHDWGSALGFDWANRHRDRVAGICYMEAIVRPVTWDEWPESARDIFRAFRSEAGEEMILTKNLFVESILPASTMRTLSDEEMNEYRRPFATPGEDRRPTLTWPRELPLAGDPADVVEIVQASADWLSTSEVPKLFINADPGAILTGAQREFVRTWPNQTETTVAGIHFIQEDSADEIGEAIAAWLPNLQRST
ncbi:MAG: haloalkane dehalogenase [Candidatus Aldehydirespiratoraceae bacterium]|jgi:haloalkane dehalogenase